MNLSQYNFFIMRINYILYIYIYKDENMEGWDHGNPMSPFPWSLFTNNIFSHKLKFNVILKKLNMEQDIVDGAIV